MARTGDAIVVVVNYRLSLLGLFALSELQEEDVNLPTTGLYFSSPFLSFMFYFIQVVKPQIMFYIFAIHTNFAIFC